MESVHRVEVSPVGDNTVTLLTAMDCLCLLTYLVNNITYNQLYYMHTLRSTHCVHSMAAHYQQTAFSYSDYLSQNSITFCTSFIHVIHSMNQYSHQLCHLLLCPSNSLEMKHGAVADADLTGCHVAD